MTKGNFATFFCHFSFRQPMVASVTFTKNQSGYITKNYVHDLSYRSSYLLEFMLDSTQRRTQEILLASVRIPSWFSVLF